RLDHKTAFVEASDQEIHGLIADPRVESVLTRGQSVGTALAQSVPKVGATSYWDAGSRGEGQAVVVIDTGVNPAFGRTLVGQACFAASATVGGGIEGHCGPGGGYEQAFSGLCCSLGVCSDDVLDEPAGAPCGTTQECAHGSAVAATAARHEVPQGVAP